MSYCTQLRSYFVTATTTVVKASPSRLHGFVCVPGGTAGILEFKDGSIAGSVVAVYGIPSIGTGIAPTDYIDGGLRFTIGAYVSQPGSCQLTLQLD